MVVLGGDSMGSMVGLVSGLAKRDELVSAEAEPGLSFEVLPNKEFLISLDDDIIKAQWGWSTVVRVWVGSRDRFAHMSLERASCVLIKELGAVDAVTAGRFEAAGQVVSAAPLLLARSFLWRAYTKSNFY
eukprot:11022796-Ditylum_brightwellii.AAC.1